MALNITTSIQAREHLDLLIKLQSLSSTDIPMFVDMKSKDVHFKQTREFSVTLAEAIVILEKSLYIWIKDTDPVYIDVGYLNLSFTDDELVGF